ncbi:MAG: Ig-like domain-containing protein [bacterium]|nr:MAG: Ig-like domain-containing protein [bacterium]
MSSIRIVRFYYILLICFALGCAEEQPYSPQDKPGKIVGRVKPSGIIVQIDLLQGTLIQTTSTDSSGYFQLDSVAAGIYNLEFSSSNHGHQILNEVIVYPGQVTTVPDVHLKPFPEQITSFTPVNGEQNFPLMAAIQIHFSTLMEHNSVENNFFLVPNVNGSFVWEIISGNSKLSFYPGDQYISNSFYMIRLTTDAKTSAGDSLSFDFISYFETEGVKITTTIPENQATFISPQSNIYVYFNSRMDRQSVEQNFLTTPIKMGNFKWFNSRRVSFQPGTFLASSTQYTVTIGANAKDIYNNSLPEDKTFTFETEPLRITSSYPANGATSINRSSQVSITFNTYVNQETVHNAFSLAPAVEGWNFQWNDLTRFQYTGSTKLQANTFYIVTVDTTCSDAWGNLLPTNYSFIFKTGN